MDVERGQTLFFCILFYFKLGGIQLVIAFQVVLLIIILAVCGTMIGEEDTKKQENLAFVPAISLALFFASLVWL